MPTIFTVRQDAIARLRAVSPTPALDADLLLGTALSRDRAYILAHPETVLTAEEAEAFERWLKRAAAGEPIAYILARRGFYDLDFRVTPAVLIPRPETELLLEAALAWCPPDRPVMAADIGTGSGALAVTFAHHRPLAHVHAVDISSDALAVAGENARIHGVTDGITWHQGSLLEPLRDAGVTLDLLMANLPYIPSGEVPELQVSQYEPALALDGGPDGLALIRALLAQMPGILRPGGLALLEFGAGQGRRVLEAAHDVLGDAVDARIIHDYAGHDRHLHLVMPDVQR
jgi:release factor glutamine methyltransferase